MEPLERKDPLRTWAIIITVVLHVGVFSAAFISNMFSSRHTTIDKQSYVDAELVRFGKPRDLSFLPHKEARVKDKPEEIKVAKDLNALPHIEEKKEKDVDPLKKTHAEQFKSLQDESEGAQPTNVGSLTGSRAGTASEAKGDPYILQLVDQIGSAWSVPTTLSDAQLANMKVPMACLTISESGTLSSYKIVEPSGNSQLDSSLDAVLSTIKKLPPPPDRDVQTANGPKNLKYLATHGKLCAEMHPPGK